MNVMRNPLSSSSRTPASSPDIGSTRVQNTRRRRGRRRSVVAGSIIAIGLVVGTGLLLRPATTALSERPATAPSDSIGPQASGLLDHTDSAQARAALKAQTAAAAANTVKAAEADRVAAEQADATAAAAAAAAAEAATEAEAPPEAVPADSTATDSPSVPGKSQRDRGHRK